MNKIESISLNWIKNSWQNARKKEKKTDPWTMVCDKIKKEYNRKPELMLD